MSCRAKKSSAARVFVAWSPARLTPRSVRNARDSAATSNASPGVHFVDSSRMCEPSGRARARRPACARSHPATTSVRGNDSAELDDRVVAALLDAPRPGRPDRAGRARGRGFRRRTRAGSGRRGIQLQRRYGCGQVVCRGRSARARCYRLRGAGRARRCRSRCSSIGQRHGRARAMGRKGAPQGRVGERSRAHPGAGESPVDRRETAAPTASGNSKPERRSVRSAAGRAPGGAAAPASPLDRGGPRRRRQRARRGSPARPVVEW